MRPLPLTSVVASLPPIYRFGEIRDNIERICGKDVRSRCPPIWGLNDEGELSGTWREIGTPGLWYMMGGCCYPDRWDESDIDLDE